MVSSRQLGKFLREARKNAGLTQDELSDKAGLAYSTLAKIEQGAIKSPSFFTVFALVEALGMDLNDLLEVAEPVEDSTKCVMCEKIKFIYVDMNGVLVRFYHRAFTSVSQETHCSLNQVEAVYWHYDDAVNSGEISLQDFNKASAKQLGVDKIDWRKHYMGAVKPVQEMKEFLESIHGKVGVGLLTNTSPGYVAELTKRNLLPDVEFDAIIDSSEVGILKPSQKIYELAEKKSGHKGEEILFIDDSRINLNAADKLGWQVMWFDAFDPEESVRRLRETLGQTS